MACDECTWDGTFPCCWPIREPECCPDWDEATDAQKAFAVDKAKWWLWAATGRRFGVCEVTIECACCREPACPCSDRGCNSASDHGVGVGVAWIRPNLRDGKWFNSDCGCDSCSCCGWTVVECQGEPVPLPGQVALGDLACALVKPCDHGDDDCTCGLPAGLSRLTRQGVTIEVDQDTLDSMVGARTGIASVDNWVEQVNPHGLTQPARIYSPDYQCQPADQVNRRTAHA